MVNINRDYDNASRIGRSGLRNIIVGGMALFAFLVCLTMVGCQKVEPGWAAVKVNQFGGSKGVQAEPITTGVIFYFKPMHDVYQFPTFTQTANWTAATGDENSEGNDSVTMNSSEGAAMNTDISIAYHFQLEKVPVIFSRFRKDADGITHGYVHQRIRDQFNQVAGTMTASDILGPKKTQLVQQVKARVNAELEPAGIIIEDLSFYGEMRIDERVKNSVNAVIEARQQAERTRQQVEQEKAEADKQIEKARGRAQSLRLESEAEAFAEKTRADAAAYANEKMNTSLTEKVMQMRSLDKWNGVLPQVMGSGSTPFVTIK